VQLTDGELRRAIHAQLRAHTVLTLATASAGIPHAVSLMYAEDEDFNICWLSDPDTRHSRHLESANRCAITVATQYDDFRTIRGLQMVGSAGREPDPGDGLKLLVARHPFLQAFVAGKLAQHSSRAAVYRFQPEMVTLIDNRRAFGFKQTLRLPTRPLGNRCCD